MPLYKKQPFPLAEKPSDLKPNERVFQVRFTKELFRGYSEYLKRINLYRRRVWTSKASGKTNLTYEEALVSENKAAEKVKQFPKEFAAPVLREIQFSMLPLRDLTNAIFEKLQGPLSEGNELYARKNSRVYPCKIVKVLEADDNIEYEVLWLGKDKKVTGNSLIKGEDLIKKLPFSKEVLKSFIRDSTYRYSPWVLHDHLAKLHGISSHPPEDLGVNLSISIQNGLVVCSRKRKKSEDEETLPGQSQSTTEEIKKQKVEPIKYPIEDLLVDPAEDDQHLTERPSLCKDFNVPMDCVGDLLMVWDFCTSFGKLLYLSPFSLEHFENALCHKDSNVVLIVETHSALLRLLMRDKNGAFSEYMRIKKRKPKITLVTWSDYLCDFLDISGIAELPSILTTVRRGHYGLLDIHVKLQILRELITHVHETNLFREKLDEYVEEGQAFAATRRGEAIEEGKKKREEKEQVKKESSSGEAPEKEEVKKESSSDEALEKEHVKKESSSEEAPEKEHVEKESSSEEVPGKDVTEPITNDSSDLQNGDSGGRNGNFSGQNGDSSERNGNSSGQNGNVSRKLNKKRSLSKKKKSYDKSEVKQADGSLSKISMKQRADSKVILENPNDSLKRKALKLMKDDIKETIENKSIEQRKEYLQREMEKRLIRTNPLGKDRNYNRYWFFRRDRRIFVENTDCTEWGYYCTKDEVDAFMGSLNVKGLREKALKMQLEKYYDKICSELQKKSKELAQRAAAEEAELRRSTRVRAPPRENPALAFMRYENRWKEE